MHARIYYIFMPKYIIYSCPNILYMHARIYYICMHEYIIYAFTNIYSCPNILYIHARIYYICMHKYIIHACTNILYKHSQIYIHARIYSMHDAHAQLGPSALTRIFKSRGAPLENFSKLIKGVDINGRLLLGYHYLMPTPTSDQANPHPAKHTFSLC